MVAAPSLDVLNSALAPVQELRGEHSQLESSVRESFAALEALHDELTEWQRELTRQQADLDQRAAAVADAEAQGHCDPAELAVLNERVTQAQDEARQLEEENAEQLQALEDLDRQFAAGQAELRSVRKHAEELTITLETERERTIDEHRLWAGELRDMRRLLERQGKMLVSLGAKPPADDDEDPNDGDEPHHLADHSGGEASAALDAAARAAELRRRATTRRANRRTT